MAGIDPNILRAIGTGQAYPGSPTSPVNATGAGAGAAGGGAVGPEQVAEPVALHDACQAACAAVDAARTALEDLAAQAEMSETIDPAVEKVISDAAEQIAKIDDALDGAEEDLGDARKEHEEMVSPDDTKV